MTEQDVRDIADTTASEVADRIATARATEEAQRARRQANEDQTRAKQEYADGL